MQVQHKGLNIGPRLVFECGYLELLLEHVYLTFVKFCFTLQIISLQFKHIIFKLQLVRQLQTVVSALPVPIVLLYLGELEILHLLVEVAHLVVELDGEDGRMVLQIGPDLNSVIICCFARFNSKFRTDDRNIIVQFLKLHREYGRIDRRFLFMLVHRVNRGRNFVIVLLLLLTELLLTKCLFVLVYLVESVVHIRAVVAHPVRFRIFIVS